MPMRPAFVRGGYYHIYNRGADRLPIFRESKNYIYLLRLLKRAAPQCHISVIAYCLLPNHYHWLLRQDGETPVGKLQARVFGSYTQAFNRAYARSGTLFEGPYRVLPVESEEYLIRACTYIHLNPVHHQLVGALDDWPYSNYLEWIGKRQGTLIDRDLVLNYFASPADYEAFVADVQQRWEPDTIQQAPRLLDG